MMEQQIKLVKQFDKGSKGWLNADERKAAREFLKKERAEGRGARGFGGRGGPGGPFFRGPGGDQKPPKVGINLAVADVKSFPNAPFYDAQTLRTFFLKFENSDWEKELGDFQGTDVEVPAELTVDGKTYPDVGVHFRGMSSYGMIGAGSKRSLNLRLDLAHKDQHLAGYRTLNLLNAHEDPTFLRPILFLEIARDYLPASKANLARVVINGENWGIYDNIEQFNKDFVKEWFGTTKGARWKVRGNPGGQGRLTYLGDDPVAYKAIYTIKTKEDPKVWASFIQMCKVLNETPADKLEAALNPLLDIEGALRFIALDNALINNDGYWIRTSDYSIYQDVKGRFHIIPADVNETFVQPGGPGFMGGFAGRGGGPGMMLGPQILSQGDKNEDHKLSKAEFSALADAWFNKLDVDRAGRLSQEQFTERFGELLPPPQGFGPPGGGRGFGPGRFVGPGLFTAADGNKDGSLTRAEIKAAFEKWASDWDSDKSGLLTEEKLRTGLALVLPQPNFGGPGAGPGGRGGRREPGRPGFGGMPRVDGVKLDPLVAANDPNKPLISKLLAVPSLRERYLSYTKDIGEKWLDWRKLGAIAERYHALIAEDVAKDTRKLDSTEDSAKGLTEDIQGSGFGPGGGGTISLKNFADQRRAYLLDYSEAKK
jgi:spore coat protein CotH